MKVIVFGATGSVGREIVNQALVDGFAVTAFSRDPQRLSLQHARLQRVQGDVCDADAVRAAVAGHDAVICALGAGLHGGLRAPGTLNIITAMQQHGVRRLVCLSTLGVGDSAVHLNAYWKYLMFGLLLRRAFRDHVTQENHVVASGLDWTLVRPSAYTDGPRSNAVQHGFGPEKRRLSLKIARADVAAFTLTALKERLYLGRTANLSC